MARGCRAYPGADRVAVTVTVSFSMRSSVMSARWLTAIDYDEPPYMRKPPLDGWMDW